MYNTLRFTKYVLQVYTIVKSTGEIIIIHISLITYFDTHGYVHRIINNIDTTVIYIKF